MSSASVGAQTEAQAFTFKTIKEASAEPQEAVTYCVDGLLKASSLSVVAAKPKCGKSTFARQLAVAVAQGKQFLGRETQQGTVLYLALEEMQSEVLNHFHELGLRDTDPLRFRCGSVDPTNAVAMLEGSIRECPNLRLVIVDPIFKFVKLKDSNDYQQINRALAPLLDLARQYGPNILTVHHMKKRETESEMDGILGSTAIYAAVDTSIALRSDAKGIRSISTSQRYGKSMDATQLGWIADTRQFTLGVTMEQADALAALARKQQMEAQMLQYVSSHPGATQQALLHAVQGNLTVKKHVMTELIDTAMLISHGGGVKGDPYTYTVRSQESGPAFGSIAALITSADRVPSDTEPSSL